MNPVLVKGWLVWLHPSTLYLDGVLWLCSDAYPVIVMLSPSYGDNLSPCGDFPGECSWLDNYGNNIGQQIGPGGASEFILSTL